MKCTHPNCSANAVKNSSDQKCFWHSQDLEIMQKRANARKRGGKHGKKLGPVVKNFYDLDDIKKILSAEVKCMIEAATHDTIRRARGVAYVCKTLAEIIERSEFENRIEALENSVFR